MQKSIEIVARGRGPQLSTSRITVQDIVPYLEQTCTNEQIIKIMPTLTVAEIEVIREYVRDNYEAVMQQDRRIREWNVARTVAPEIEEIRIKGRARVLALLEEFSSKKAQERNGDHSPG